MEILPNWHLLSTQAEAQTVTSAIIGAASAPVGIYLLGIGTDQGPAALAVGISSRWRIGQAAKEIILAHQPSPLAAFIPFEFNLDQMPDEALAFYRLVPGREAVWMTSGHMLTVAKALKQIRGPLVAGFGAVIWGWKKGSAKVDVAGFAIATARNEQIQPQDVRSLAWGIGAAGSRGNAIGISRPVRTRRD